MNALDLLDRDGDVPLRVLAIIAAVPSVLAAITLAADPSWKVAVWLLIAVSPWLLQLFELCPPWPYAGLLPIGAVALLMSRWRVTDLSLMLLVFLVGQSAMLHPRRLAAAVLGLCIAVPVAYQIATPYGHVGAWAIGMALAALSGGALRMQQLTLARLEAAQEELAMKAVADERRRIAREVHDLAAHSMAVTMLHLTGARLALADGEVAEAESALAAAERLGRSSMDEIRRAVGVLADPATGTARAPEPSAADIVTLVDDYRRAGVVVTFNTRGSASEAGAVLGLTLFRLVQESLANAAHHAPGAPVLLDLAWTDDSVTLEVSNPVVDRTATPGSGHGLVGMRERVEQFGGVFSSGAVADVWQVRATLPCHAPTLEPR